MSWTANMRPRWLLSVGFVGALGIGCATYSDKTQSMRELISAGQYEAGLAEINRFIKVKDPVELPTKWKI